MSNIDTIQIYNSRLTLMEIYAELGYAVDDYNSFSMNEVEAMQKNEQLDMLLSHKAGITPSIYDGTKIYVKYMLVSKAVRMKTVIEEIIEELYDLENVLQKRDTLVIIMNDEPNDTLVEKLKYWYDSRGIHVVVHNIKRLQRNILKHTMVPKHTILTVADTEALKTRLNLSTVNQLPEISRFDPVALLICMKPGQVCRIDRKSVTSVTSTYYRVCV